jgi:hypothetical protein
VDDIFPIILFIIFFVAPLIEQLKKKKGQPPAPPPPRPQARPQPQPRSSTEEVSSRPRETAEAMVPDDLWKILTGEARPPVMIPEETRRVPTQKQRPWDVVYIPPEETEDEEELARDDVDVEVRRTSREAVQLEHARRHLPVEARRELPVEAASLEVEPNIISLETPLPSAQARHAAFHQRIAEPLAAEKQKKGAFALTDHQELRRAFVMQEIFGRPRGLD